MQSPDSLAQFDDNDDYVVSDGTSTTKELLVFNDRVAPVRQRAGAQGDLLRDRHARSCSSSIWGDYGTLIGSMVPPTDPWYVDLTERRTRTTPTSPSSS